MTRIQNQRKTELKSQQTQTKETEPTQKRTGNSAETKRTEHYKFTIQQSNEPSYDSRQTRRLD